WPRPWRRSSVPAPPRPGPPSPPAGRAGSLPRARLREAVGPGGGEGPEFLVGGDRHGAEVRMRVAEPVRRAGHLAVLRIVHDLPPEPLSRQLVVADAEVPGARGHLTPEPREHLDERVVAFPGDPAHHLPDAVVLLVHALARVVHGIDVAVRLEHEVHAGVVATQAVAQLLELPAELLEREAAPAVVPVPERRGVDVRHAAADVPLVARAPEEPRPPLVQEAEDVVAALAEVDVDDPLARV